MSARYPDSDPADPWAAPATRPPEPGLADPETDQPDGWVAAGSNRPDWSMASYPPFAGRPPIVTVRDLWAALGVIVMCTALGVAAGFVWIAVAPKLQLEVRGDAAVPVQPEGEALIGIDGTFALIAIGAGVLCAIAGYLWLRRGIGVVCGPAMLAATDRLRRSAWTRSRAASCSSLHSPSSTRVDSMRVTRLASVSRS